VGRYALFAPIACGGMASVHLGRLIGPVGFTRTVAIKRLHENVARDPEFVAMFLDEARLVARINHSNVVPTLDVVALERELLLVMEYVCGESLAALLRLCRETARPPPIPVAVDIAIGMLNGLHAAHEATSESGQSLNIVHRDVTPHNVLVGVDGVARMVDFGIAKATNTTHQTRAGEVKGKLSYMAPEQLEGAVATRSVDIYSAAVVLWEALTCKQLFKGESEGATIHSVLKHHFVDPSRIRRDIPLAIDAIVRRGLDANPSKRWETAKAMAEALERAMRPVTRRTVGEWVTETARDEIRRRQQKVALVESNVMPSRPLSLPPRPMSLETSNAPSRQPPPTPPRSTSPEMGNAPSRQPPTSPPQPTLLETAQVGGSLGTAQNLSQVLSRRPIDAIRRVSVTAMGGIGVVMALVLIWAIAPRRIRQPTEAARLSAAIPPTFSGVVPRVLPPVSTLSAVASTELPSARSPVVSAIASAAPAQKRSSQRATPIGQPRSVSSRATTTDSIYRRD
jgi:eukaryotic-like serine/threonine-protein kinase